MSTQSIPMFGRWVPCKGCNKSFYIMRPDDYYRDLFSHEGGLYLIHRKRNQLFDDLNVDGENLRRLERYLKKLAITLKSATKDQLMEFIHSQYPPQEAVAVIKMLNDLYTILIILGSVSVNPLAQDPALIADNMTVRADEKVMELYIQHRHTLKQTENLEQDLEWIKRLEEHVMSQGRNISSTTCDDLDGFFKQHATDIKHLFSPVSDFFQLLAQKKIIIDNPIFTLRDKLLRVEVEFDEEQKVEPVTPATPVKPIQAPQKVRHIAVTHAPVVTPQPRRKKKPTLWIIISILTIIVLAVFANHYYKKPNKRLLVDTESMDTGSPDNQKVQGHQNRKITTSKKIEKKKSSLQDYFANNTMKDYYCRDYLQTTCNSTNVTINPLSGDWDSVKNGSKYYFEYCVRCHGDYGKGNGQDAIYLKNMPKQLGWSGSEILERDAYLFWIIAEGGGQFGGSMPAFKDILKERNIWQTILFLKTLR